MKVKVLLLSYSYLSIAVSSKRKPPEGGFLWAGILHFWFGQLVAIPACFHMLLVKVGHDVLMADWAFATTRHHVIHR
jgi:hypothetical protein